MKIFVLAFLPLINLTLAYGQFISGGPLNSTPSGQINGVYLQEHIATKRLIPYPHTREADVIWSKRVWRYIDLREKVNLSWYYPMDDFSGNGYWNKNSSVWSLWTIIRTHVMEGDLTVFDPENPYALGTFDGDQFKYPIYRNNRVSASGDSLFMQNAFRLFGKLGPQSTIPCSTYDGIDSTRVLADGTIELVYPPRDTTWISSKDIVQYRLKEDWFFDKERSVMDVRILGICPVIYEYDNNGNNTGLRELFWLYFPQCRFVFNNYLHNNPDNDAQWLSCDDLFWKRRFSSTIYKQSNVFDRKIESYRSGVEALMESEKIHDEIRNVEHDLWNY